MKFFKAKRLSKALNMKKHIIKLNKHDRLYDSMDLLNEKAFQLCFNLLNADNVNSYFHFNADIRRIFPNGNKVYEVSKACMQQGDRGREIVLRKALVLVNRAEYMTHILSNTDANNLFYAKRILNPAPIGEEYHIRLRKCDPNLSIFNVETGNLEYSCSDGESLYIKDGKVNIVKTKNI